MEMSVYEAIVRAVRLDRADIFGTGDEQRPISETQDSTIPQIGFIGANYRRGGTIFLGINPGGGGDTYIRTPGDACLLPMIRDLRAGMATPLRIQSMFDQCATAMRSWNLWRIVGPTLAACGSSQSEIAYLNWCPFRTRGDGTPRAKAMRRCRDLPRAADRRTCTQTNCCLGDEGRETADEGVLWFGRAACRAPHYRRQSSVPRGGQSLRSALPCRMKPRDLGRSRESAEALTPHPVMAAAGSRC